MCSRSRAEWSMARGAKKRKGGPGRQEKKEKKEGRVVVGGRGEGGKRGEEGGKGGEEGGKRGGEGRGT